MASKRAQYFDGQIVHVVGGCDDGLDKRMFECDDFPTVVRINDHWLRQGGRIDVAYCGCPQHVLDMAERWRGKSVKPKLVMLGMSLERNGSSQLHERAIQTCQELQIEVERFDVRRYERCNRHGPEYEWCNALWKRLKTMPLTGVLAVCDILERHSPEFVFVTGFSFYASVAGNIPEKRHSHKLKSQVDLFRTYFQTNARFMPDEPLKDLLLKEEQAIDENKSN